MCTFCCCCYNCSCIAILIMIHNFVYSINSIKMSSYSLYCSIYLFYIIYFIQVSLYVLLCSSCVILTTSLHPLVTTSLVSVSMLLQLLSRFRCVQLCATPQTAAYKAPPSLGFSRQEHWSGLPFPSPMHDSEMWKWSRSVVSDSSRPHGLQPTRLIRPWDFPGKSTGVGRHCFLPVSMSFPYFVIYNSLFCFFRFHSKSYNWRRKHQPTPVLLPGESRGQRTLVVYSPWGHKV